MVVSRVRYSEVDINMEPIPEVETSRLRLRGWRMEDFEAYLSLESDADLKKYVLGGTSTREQAWDSFCAIAGQWVHRDVGVFLVADRATDQALGFSGLWYPPDITVPELCWSLFPGNEGKGFATEAAMAARQWAHEARGYHQLVSYVHPDNLPSRAVAERLGATLECHMKLRGEDRLLYRHPDLSGS